MTLHMRFVGADTRASSILTLFPVWAKLLDLDARLTSLDIPLGSPPEAFREAIASMRADPDCVGALVTTHKISMFAAAADMFDQLDDFATECGEISSIAISADRLAGAAKDPLTAGLALAEVLDDKHFAGGGHVWCFGAGGAGTAIGWYLARRADAPAVMTFVDNDQQRLDHLRSVVQPHAAGTELVTAVAGGELVDRLAGLPPGSLVINATGMGKERPGSPLPSNGMFPFEGIVWELNYRGSLEFLAQARAQQHDRRLTVVDGWRYFIHGWTQVMAEVFALDMSTELVRRLAAAAEQVRR